MKAFAESQVSDVQMRFAAEKFSMGEGGGGHVQQSAPVPTPTTKEAYLYRQLFENHFPSPAAARTAPSTAADKSVACSTEAALKWMGDKVGGDPSGRAVAGVHLDAYEDSPR